MTDIYIYETPGYYYICDNLRLSRIRFTTENERSKWIEHFVITLKTDVNIIRISEPEL
jgi:hypothetical protein